LYAAIFSGYDSVGTIIEAKNEWSIFPVFRSNVVIHRLKVRIGREFVEDERPVHAVEPVGPILGENTVGRVFSEMHANPMRTDLDTA
jgi:hypothetical protein